MKIMQKIKLVEEIAVSLQAQMVTSDINLFLSSFGIECPNINFVKSKRIYVKDLLKDQSTETIIKIATELELPIEEFHEKNQQVRNVLMDEEKPKPQIDIFFSYSHKDESLRDELEVSLAMLKNQGIINNWHDRRISAGSEWEGHIDENLNKAHVILLLISRDFLASRYCYDIELSRAMARHDNGEARVIPVILRACDWEGAPFGKLQALPRDAKPITSWPNHDEAFENVAKGIRKAVEEVSKNINP